MAQLVCPDCGSRNLRFSRSKTVWEKVQSLFGFCPSRCRDCDARFTKAIVWTSGFVAHCPRCLSDKLTDWSEPYYYPPYWQQLLLHVGAKAHRCAACRVNFISFFGRHKPAAVPAPAWKDREVA